MARTGGKKESGGTRLGDFRKQPGEPKPVYVLRGTDPYLMDQARRAIRQLVLGDADPGMAILEMNGADAALADVLDALRTPAFLAPRRLVILREAEKFFGQRAEADDGDEAEEKTAGGGGHQRDALLRYLEKPSPTGCLVLEVAAWNESTNLAKGVAKAGTLVLCEITDPAIMPGWLQREARKTFGKTLTAAATQMLLEYLGMDVAGLLAALDMLALYTGAEKTIDAPDVDALVARGHHERVWAICDAVAERRIPRALELLDAFLTEGMVAAQIVGILRPTFRQLLRVKALTRRMSVDAAMEKAGVTYFARDRVRRAIAAFSGAHLADAYQTLVEADLDAKSGTDERTALETMIHRLCLPEAARTAARGVAD